MTTRIVHDGSIKAVCDTESTRYALAGVHVMPAGNGEVYLTATDGRCLAIVKAEGEVEDFDPDKPPIVPAAILPKSRAECNKLRWDDEASVSKDIRLNGSGKWETPYNRLADPIEGRFPRAVDVIPDASGTTMAVSLDVRILDKLHKALTDNSDPALTLLFTIPDREEEDNGPYAYGTAVNVIGSRGIGVIMPLRADDKRKVTDHVKFEEYRQAVAAVDKAWRNPPEESDDSDDCDNSADLPSAPSNETLDALDALLASC